MPTIITLKHLDREEQILSTKNMVVQPDLVVHTSSSSAREAEADRVKVSLVYTASSRTAKATREKTVLNQATTTKTIRMSMLGDCEALLTHASQPLIILQKKK